MLAARGARDMDRGEERIADASLAAGLRQRAGKVHVESLLTAAILTALWLLAPR